MRQGTQDLIREVGRGLGTGLINSLEKMGAHKADEIMHKKKALEISSAFNVPYETASFIAHQPEATQRDLFDRLDGLVAGVQNQTASNDQYQSNDQQIGQQGLTHQRPNRSEVKQLGSTFGMSSKAKSEANKEIANRFKESKAFRSELLERKKSSRSDLQDLTRLEELSDSGKLDTPGWVEMIKRAGLDIPALTNPESEEFQKIQQNFLKNAKQYFGGRISNYEVEQFLKTIPSLSQSPEGRKRVIANLKHIARGQQEYYKAYEDVLKENGNIPPYDIQEQVERKADKRLDKISDLLKKDLAKPVPKGQNKFITAIQAAAGSSAKPLLGAGLGFVAGGPLGAAIGGGAGLASKLSGLL